MLSSVLRIYFRIRKLQWRITRPVTVGVRVIPFDGDGRVLMVRHTYMDGWFFPGGGVDRGESMPEAAIRELREEVGLEARTEPRLIAIQTFFHWGKSDHVGLYRTTVDGPPKAERLEIAEAGYFALDALPDGLHHSTHRQLEALRSTSAESSAP